MSGTLSQLRNWEMTVPRIWPTSLRIGEPSSTSPLFTQPAPTPEMAEVLHWIIGTAEREHVDVAPRGADGSTRGRNPVPQQHSPGSVQGRGPRESGSTPHERLRNSGHGEQRLSIHNRRMTWANTLIDRTSPRSHSCGQDIPGMWADGFSLTEAAFRRDRRPCGGKHCAGCRNPSRYPQCASHSRSAAVRGQFSQACHRW